MYPTQAIIDQRRKQLPRQRSRAYCHHQSHPRTNRHPPSQEWIVCFVCFSPYLSSFYMFSFLLHIFTYSCSISFFFCLFGGKFFFLFSFSFCIFLDLLFTLFLVFIFYLFFLNHVFIFCMILFFHLVFKKCSFYFVSWFLFPVNLKCVLFCSRILFHEFLILLHEFEICYITFIFLFLSTSRFVPCSHDFFED
jgi:hypothetical protein